MSFPSAPRRTRRVNTWLLSRRARGIWFRRAWLRRIGCGLHGIPLRTHARSVLHFRSAEPPAGTSLHSQRGRIAHAPSTQAPLRHRPSALQAFPKSPSLRQVFLPPCVTQICPAAQALLSTHVIPSVGSARQLPVCVRSAALQYVSTGHWLGSARRQLSPLATAATQANAAPSYAQLKPSLHNDMPGVHG